MQMVGKRLHETLDDDEGRKLLYETSVTWAPVKNSKAPKVRVAYASAQQLICTILGGSAFPL